MCIFFYDNVCEMEKIERVRGVINLALFRQNEYFSYIITHTERSNEEEKEEEENDFNFEEEKRKLKKKRSIK